MDVVTPKRLLHSTEKLEFLHHVYNELMPVGQCFPKLLQALKITMTMGVSSASAERSFSSLHLLKVTFVLQCLKNGSHTLHFYILREIIISSQLWDCLDDIVMEFAGKHENTRIVLV